MITQRGVISILILTILILQVEPAFTGVGPVPQTSQNQRWNYEWRDDFDYGSLSEMEDAGWEIRNRDLVYLENGYIVLDNDGRIGSSIAYRTFPGGIIDWRVETRGMWIGRSYGTLTLFVITEKHTYAWWGDGYYPEFVFSRDGEKVKRFTGYTPRLREWFTFTLEKRGDTLYMYANGELVNTYVEPEGDPGELRGVCINSGWRSKTRYDYILVLGATRGDGYALKIVSFSLSPSKAAYDPREAIQAFIEVSYNFPEDAYIGVVISRRVGTKKWERVVYNPDYDVRIPRGSGTRSYTLSFRVPDQQGSYEYRVSAMYWKSGMEDWVVMDERYFNITVRQQRGLIELKISLISRSYATVYFDLTHSIDVTDDDKKDAFVHIEIPSGARRLRVDMAVEDDDDIDMCLYRPDGSEVDCSTRGTGDGEEVTVDRPAGGEWTLHVFEFKISGTTARVAVTASIEPAQEGDSYEPDDSMSEAKKIASGERQRRSIDPVGDVDFAWFIVTERSRVRVETSGPSGDTVLRIYDSDGDLVSQNDDFGDGRWSAVELELDPGKYYIEVFEYGKDDKIPEYYLTLTISSIEHLLRMGEIVVDSARDLKIKYYIEGPSEVRAAGTGTTWNKYSITVEYLEGDSPAGLTIEGGVIYVAYDRRHGPDISSELFRYYRRTPLADWYEFNLKDYMRRMDALYLIIFKLIDLLTGGLPGWLEFITELLGIGTDVPEPPWWLHNTNSFVAHEVPITGGCNGYKVSFNLSFPEEGEHPLLIWIWVRANTPNGGYRDILIDLSHGGKWITIEAKK